MSPGISILSNKSLVLIFAYAPAGLGHLRITDALYHGLPKGSFPLLLGSQDETITYLHRITSVHPVARAILEWAQRGRAENLFTRLYVAFLRRRTKLIHEQMTTILSQRIDLPETVLVVATHFGLAHQLAKIKNTLTQETKIKIVLVVQVTDDSPQRIWYVEGADMIFVPSEKTKESLIEYGKKNKLKEVNFDVIPYPVSPILTERLAYSSYKARVNQVDYESKAVINMNIPISGAAVGTNFFTEMIDVLYRFSKRFKFHVISKASLYTQIFLNQMLERSYVELHVSTHDRGVLDKYDEVYQNAIISLEVTKPSEQSFKALISPQKKGGVILLFSEPVGRQEYDNLDFLRRHQLIPSRTDQNELWKKAEQDSSLKGTDLLSKAKNWRGLEIPRDPKAAAVFIWWCLKEEVFSQMMNYKAFSKLESHKELGQNGVNIFWDKVAELLSQPAV